jgi:hypothetical protein
MDIIAMFFRNDLALCGTPRGPQRDPPIPSLDSKPPNGRAGSSYCLFVRAIRRLFGFVILAVPYILVTVHAMGTVEKGLPAISYCVYNVAPNQVVFVSARSRWLTMTPRQQGCLQRSNAELLGKTLSSS